MKDMIKCQCCKKEITKKNFWTHQHDDYQFGDEGVEDE